MRITFAPLEGITGYIYRNTYQEYYGGIDRYYSPFLVTRDRGIMKKKELRDILPENNLNIDLVPQLLTNKTENFLQAAAFLRSRSQEAQIVLISLKLILHILISTYQLFAFSVQRLSTASLDIADIRTEVT